MSFKPKLELKQTKGRISTAAPQTLACLLQSLRPILHIACPNSMLSYSKGSRGLFVPSRVIGIFTDTTISLSSRLRQCPDHYTFRAGQNLPDKEFRYLRTVIVTAAVHWGFGSMLRIKYLHFPLTFQHWAGVSSYTSSFDLAETCVFVKQLLGPLLCDHTFIWYPFSLSYGVSLPSSLTMLLSLILGSSPHLPVSVCGTGTYIQDSQAFLASVLLENSLLYFHYIFRYEFFLFLASLSLLCPLCFLSISVVQEFLPAVHRLRLSASP